MTAETLIIDDDKVICYLHKRICGKASLPNPTTFSEPCVALDYISQRNSEDFFFLVFLDINMPGKSGWDVLQELEALSLTSKTYIVLVTSSIDKLDKDKAKNYPLVQEFVSKPLTETKAAELLEAATEYWEPGI
ncbi:response regulator [Zeaxanthinibacter enoshimensis]|uniref:CheY-like chemotaxis protein n=1 Tax=Zeaxanthinibacter enoshimensis TaxID=392009 RepID=A0A4V3D3C6_9FLAO|nr:response regulator [Zeaxanthinibacter enoshimensis]TDQ29074.1 CheY-like chemotaxis protein [Zeaxanthinibacter enoshimensis]